MTAEEKFRAGEVSAPAPTPTKLEWTFLAAHRAIDYIHRVTGCLKGETHRLVTLWENNIAEIIRVAASEVQPTPTEMTETERLEHEKAALLAEIFKLKELYKQAAQPKEPTDERAEQLLLLIEQVKTTRTAWLDQHGVPISMEFVRFAQAIGDLCDAARVLCGGTEKVEEKKP